MQTLKKNWLLVWKITWGIWQIFTNALESWDSKLELVWGTFIPSRKCMSLKLTGESDIMTMKKMQNLKRNWLVQNWSEEFNKFWYEHSKISKICTLMRSFWSKYIIFELKKYRRVTFDGTEAWCKVWRKTDLCFLKWHEEFVKFSFTGWK